MHICTDAESNVGLAQAGSCMSFDVGIGQKIWAFVVQASSPM